MSKDPLAIERVVGEPRLGKCNRRYRERAAFTSKDLFTGIFLLSLLAMIVILWVQSSRREARQTSCANSLRQLCLTVHQYHESQQRMPPVADHGSWGASWATQLVPQILGTCRNSSYYPYYYDEYSQFPVPPLNLKGHELQNLTDRMFVCPERRGPMLSNDSGAGITATPTDYVACNSTTECWAVAGLPSRGEFANGSFVLPEPMAPQPNALPRLWPSGVPNSPLAFGDITDGLAHTAFFGEKHFYKQWKFGSAADMDGVCFTIGNSPAHYNSTIRRMGSEDDSSHGGNCKSVGLGIYDAGTEGSKVLASFGSWHGGVCLFAMGDCHVEAIRNDLDPLMCGRLIRRDDSRELLLNP